MPLNSDLTKLEVHLVKSLAAQSVIAIETKQSGRVGTENQYR